MLKCQQLLTFVSMINTTYEGLKGIKVFIVQHFSFYELSKGVQAIRHIFSLVDMITNTKFSKCPIVFKTGVVWQ